MRYVLTHTGLLAIADPFWRCYYASAARRSLPHVCVHETFRGKTRILPSIHLPHLHPSVSSRQAIGFMLFCTLALLWDALCDSCSSDRRFACAFFQIPPHDGHPWRSASSWRWQTSPPQWTFITKIRAMPGTRKRSRRIRDLSFLQ